MVHYHIGIQYFILVTYDFRFCAENACNRHALQCRSPGARGPEKLSHCSFADLVIALDHVVGAPCLV